jgi:hypothetical protein
MTPSGNERATFRPVEQCLSQMCHRLPVSDFRVVVMQPATPRTSASRGIMTCVTPVNDGLHTCTASLAVPVWPVHVCNNSALEDILLKPGAVKFF